MKSLANVFPSFSLLPPRLRGAGVSLPLALILSIPFSSSPAIASEPPMPPPVARYASILPEGPQRPWNLAPEVSAALGTARYPDPVPMPKSYAVPAEISKGEGEDEAFRNLKRGFDALREERLDDALFEFQEGAKKTARSSDECWFWLGETRVRKGKFAEAAVAYSRVSGELKREALYRLARISGKEGRAQAALAAWGEIASDEGSPYRGEALFRIGVQSVQEGAEGEAQVDFANALAILPADGDAAVAAAFEAARINRDGAGQAEAERLLRSLLLARPDHPLAEGGRVLLAWVESDGGKFDGAGKRAEAALASGTLLEGFAVRARYLVARSAAASGDLDKAGRTASELLLVLDGPWAGWSSADRAYALYDTGRFEAALSAYREAEKLWKGEGGREIAFAEGECLYRLGRYSEAAAAFAKVDGASEALPWARHRAAEALAKVGERKPALELLGKLLADKSGYPEISQARTLAGRLHFEEGDYSEALDLIKNSADASADGEILNYLRGWEAFEAEKYGTAAELFERHLALGPYARKRVEAATFLARAEHENGRVDKALSALRIVAAEAEAPDQVEKARFEIGWLLINAGRDAEGSAELARLIQDFPKGGQSAKARYALAQSAMIAGRFNEAAKRFAEVDATSGGADLARLAARGRIEALFALSMDEEALAESRKLGEDPEALSTAVMALVRLGRLDEALAEADKFAAKYPTDPGLADLDLATVEALVAKERKPEAIERLAKVGARLSGARRDQALLRRAELLEESGKGEEALAQYSAVENAVEVDARVHAARRAAALEAALGRRAEALARLEKASRQPGVSDEFSHQLLNDIAINLSASGDYQGSLERARRASTMGDGDGPEALRTDLIIAEALEKSGNPNAALETLLRIGYHYDLRRAEAADAARRAATQLEIAGRRDEAGELRARLAAAQAEAAPAPDEKQKAQ